MHVPGKARKAIVCVIPPKRVSDLASRLKCKKKFKAMQSLNTTLVFACLTGFIAEYKGLEPAVLLMSSPVFSYHFHS